jgi:succinate dehydrogenase / fumarate reductase cytochrome b subunit
MSATVSNISMSFATQVTGTSIGKKVLMAITGFVSFGYVVGHMVGNLQIFAGQNAINQYAEFLHSLGNFLWIIRAVLLAFFVTHIWLGIQLKVENWSSRPQNYKYQKSVQTSLASRTMIYTGLTVLAFFVYHILHFTARVTDPRYQNLVDSDGRYDVYSMMIMGFQSPVLSGVYIVALALVAYHLSHGVSSMFQSLGLNNPHTQKVLDRAAVAVAIIIFIGFTSIPVAVLAGWVTLPEGVH